MEASPVINIPPADLEQLKVDLLAVEATWAHSHGPGHLRLLPISVTRRRAGLAYTGTDGDQYGAGDLFRVPQPLRDFLELWFALDQHQIQEGPKPVGDTGELAVLQVLEQPELRPATTAGWATRTELLTALWHEEQHSQARSEKPGLSFDAVKAEVEALKQAGLAAIRAVYPALPETFEAQLLAATPTVLRTKPEFYKTDLLRSQRAWVDVYYRLDYRLSDTVGINAVVHAPDCTVDGLYSADEVRVAVQNYLSLLQFASQRPDVQAEILWERTRVSGRVDQLEPIDWEHAAQWSAHTSGSPAWLMPTLPEYEFGGLDRFARYGAI